MKAVCEYDIPHGAFVEIGSWQGKSSCFISTALKHCKPNRSFIVSTLLMVPQINKITEIFSQLMEMIENDEQVIIHRMSSTEAVKSWNDPIAFLYIDGDYEYEAVLQDFENWSKFLLPGALISFDDVPGWPGPTRVAGIVISKQEFQKYGVAPNVLTFKKIS
ncbi:hypothetical protein Gasu2_64540 [Galdieria sulphuraria]|nr:hypothetical protein Gasu2_64540 [Galdieria sulphuraria]